MFWSAGRGDALEEVSTLLDTSKTILGQPVSYPTGSPAKVTAAIVTMPPGETTGWHEHPVPLFANILEGEVTVDYGPHGKRIYRKGDSLMEAIDTAHDGHNTGQGVARILAVFMGAEGVANTTNVAPPK
jgi:quercetin dioxygenase-like cupin family protein